jgi:hypothetical protein
VPTEFECIWRRPVLISEHAGYRMQEDYWDKAPFRCEFKYLLHTSTFSRPTRELLDVILVVISLLMCFAKHNFVAVCIVQTVKLGHIYLWIATIFEQPKIWIRGIL